jgi:hypothetical protein
MICSKGLAPHISQLCLILLNGTAKQKLPIKQLPNIWQASATIQHWTGSSNLLPYCSPTTLFSMLHKIFHIFSNVWYGAATSVATPDLRCKFYGESSTDDSIRKLLSAHEVARQNNKDTSDVAHQQFNAWAAPHNFLQQQLILPEEHNFLQKN